MKKISFIISLIAINLLQLNAQRYSINPYDYLIGSCAVNHNSHIYTINPASIGLLKSSMLYQNFTIDNNPEKVFFSENLVIQEFKHHSLLMGWSLIDDKEVNLKNSLFRINYVFNLFNLIYTGINFSYKDASKKQFHKSNLMSDLGILLNLNINGVIKYINVGIYGLNSKPEKLNFKFPNVNYGKNSSWGMAVGLDSSKYADVVLSADIKLVNDNTVLSANAKAVTYGIQFQLKNYFPHLSLMTSGKKLNSEWLSSSVGISMNLNIFNITYAGKNNNETKEKEQYLSISFPLFNNRTDNVSVSTAENEEEDIKMFYYKDNKDYKIIFKGDRKKVVYWTLKIRNIQDTVVREYCSVDMLPENITWDGKNKEGKEVPDGIYKIKIYALQDNLLLEINEDEKTITKKSILNELAMDMDEEIHDE